MLICWCIVHTLLHGDDSELIFLINPDKEGFGIIVVNTTALRPVTLHTSSDQVLVTRNKKEMVINKLLAGFLWHSQEWEV